jgi:CBS domain-containing protein
VATIRDIMNDRPVTIPSEATVRQAIETLTRHHIGGAPVVTGAGSIVGIISEQDLIDVVFVESMRDAPVSNYMTPEVHVAHPDDRLSRAVQLFALYSFRRLPVVEDGKLVGVVTRRDLINHALGTNQLLADPLVELIPSLAPMS